MKTYWSETLQKRVTIPDEQGVHPMTLDETKALLGAEELSVEDAMEQNRHTLVCLKALGAVLSNDFARRQQAMRQLRCLRHVRDVARKPQPRKEPVP